MVKPEDIEKKTFSTALRGYDLNEVDDFLDEVIATLRDLEEQVASSQSGKASAAKHEPLHDESAVGRAMIAAQNAADQILEEARQEADRIRAEARSEADTWVTEREALQAEAQKEMADLTARVSNVRRELAVLATGVADSLDQMDAAIATTVQSTATEREAVAEVVEETEILETETVVHTLGEADQGEEVGELDELWNTADSMESEDSPDSSPADEFDYLADAADQDDTGGEADEEDED